MKEKKEEMSDILDRIFKLIDFKGYNSLRDFSINALGYDNSEKINRYKKSGTPPSIDIILDISRIFDDVSLDWLISGRGEMLRSSNIVQGERNAVGNNQGTITGHNVGDNSINIAAPNTGKQKIIHPDRTIEIEQSAQDDSSLVELQEAYKLALTTIENQKLEITSLKDKVMDLQHRLIDKLENDK